MTDLPDRIFEAIAEVARNAAELKALQPTQMRIGLSTPDGRSLVVSSDPSADLRRCEADKRTVERHAPVVGILNVGQCNYCAESWPCPDLLDRVDAWGVTTEETTT